MWCISISNPTLHLQNVPCVHRRAKTQISARKKWSDSDLLSELAVRADEVKTQMAQREEALGKSTELLFSDLCRHVAAGEDRFAADWCQMEEDDKWVLLTGFVDSWSAHFHPLSVRSVKEMVEDYLLKNPAQTETERTTPFYEGLRKLLGF